MKHYICIEENQLVYVCGRYHSGRYIIERADVLTLPREHRDQAVREFAARNKLAGRRVIAALDSNIFLSMLNLPGTKYAQLREMARNELTHTIGMGEPLVICPLPYHRNREGTNTTVLTYAMMMKHFHRHIGLLEQVGVRCRKVYIRSNCMGQMAAELFPDKKTMILVEAGEEHLRIQLIENGYCLLARNIRLNVRHFCEAGAFGLLYDEISEQISKAIQFHKSRNKTDAVELIAVASDVLPDKQGAARAIGVNLSIQCQVVTVPVELPDSLDPELIEHCHSALAVICKHQSRRSREAELLSAERAARSREGQTAGVLSKTTRLFVFSIILLGSLMLFLKTHNYFTYKRIQELNSNIEYSGQEEGYRQAVEQRRRLKELAEYQQQLHKNEGDIRQRDRFGIIDYQIFMDAAGDTAEISGIRYNGEAGICAVDLRAADPRQFAAVTERIRAANRYREVTYDYWEYIEESEEDYYYTVTILAAYGEGNEHEAE